MLLKRYKNIEEEGLQRAWKSFENSGAMVSPFLYYDYMKWIFNGGFLNNRGYKPFVECVENEAGEILAIFPMKKKFLFGTKIKMLGDMQGCGCAGGIFSPKLSDSEKEKCIRLFFKTLFERGNVRLSRIREDSLGYRYMKKIFEQVPRLKKQACVTIEFGDDYEAYLKSLSSSVRQNLRTADNRMRRDGHEWKLRVFLPGEKIDDESFKQIMKLYRAAFRTLQTKFGRKPVETHEELVFLQPYKTRYFVVAQQHQRMSFHSLHRWAAGMFHVGLCRP